MTGGWYTVQLDGFIIPIVSDDEFLKKWSAIFSNNIPRLFYEKKSVLK